MFSYRIFLHFGSTKSGLYFNWFVNIFMALIEIFIHFYIYQSDRKCALIVKSTKIK